MMKEETPILFELFCNEIYDDIKNIENISFPTGRNSDFTIHIKGQESQYTPSEELDGFIFNNGIILDTECIWETERKMKKLVE